MCDRSYCADGARHARPPALAPSIERLDCIIPAMTAWRAAFVLTIWIDAVAVFVLVAPVNAEWLELPVTFMAISQYVWMALRWVLNLALLIRHVRTSPSSKRLTMPLRAAGAVMLQVVAGFLSVIGWLMIVINQSAVEHVAGLFFHVLVPTVVVAILARKSRNQAAVRTASPT